jgi:outer membrane autotransporter protein
MKLKSLRSSLLLSSTVAVSGIVGYGRQAYAQCAPTTLPTYLCAGSNTATQSIDEDNATVSTLPGFSVDTTGTGGNAIEITGGGDLSFNDANQSVITGAGDGLRITSDSADGQSVTVYVSGTVTGNSDGDAEGIDRGIFARNLNPYGSGNLTVTTGANSVVKGPFAGIDARDYGAGDLVIDADGDVEGQLAIFANNQGGGDLKITTGEDSVVAGVDAGISAINYAGGDLIIDVGGKVTASRYEGIIASQIGARSDVSDLRITTSTGSEVSGTSYGIRASNSSSGDLIVEANGKVTAGTVGIDAIANSGLSAGDVTVITGAGSRVMGGTSGIQADTGGYGTVTVEANGYVSGATEFGIRVLSSTDNSGLMVTTGGDSEIRGLRTGIYALNSSYTGNGDLSIKANGLVVGTNEDGIYATNSYASSSLAVVTGAGSRIEGGRYGIYADIKNNDTGAYAPSGELSVEVNGDVVGKSQTGVFARIYNELATGDMTVTAGADASIVGRQYGIKATNYGRGGLTVSMEGSVTAESRTGIWAEIDNSSATGDLVLMTGASSSIYGREYGIRAANYGTGNLTVTANGDITGEREDGIYALSNNDAGGDISVTTVAGSRVTGNRYGVFARGGNAIDIQVDGDASGDRAGLRVQGYLAPVTVSIGGHVFNSSGSAADLAVDIGNEEETLLSSSGRITGRVELSEFDDVFVNNGTWLSNGDSEFKGGEDELQNAGLIRAGGTEDAADTTRFLSLLELRNAGTISLVDQTQNDGSNISDSLVIEGDYEGEGGVLALDVSLGGAGSQADVLTVTGNSSGTTFVAVNETQAGFAGLNPDGILVAVVEGTHSASDFDALGGYYSSGLYSYDVVYDGSGPEGLFLLKGFAGLHAFEVAAVVSGAQNIFFDTTASWAERQNQLRDWHARGRVVAVADPPTPEDVNDTGLWLSLRGTDASRDAEADWDALGNTYAFDTGYDQTTWSLTGGADFGVSLAGGSLLFGVLAGYVSSSQDLNASDTEIDYEGGSLGAYASFLAGGFFASLLGKADFLGVDYSPAGGPEDSTSGTNLGLRADAGYRFGLGAAYLEPVASLAAVWTEIDDFALYDTTAKPGTNDAVQIGGGARLGWETEALAFSLTGRVWDALGGDNEVGLVVPGTTLDSVTDASFQGTFGEVSGEASYRLTSRAAASLSASYLFNEDQTALSGAAGISFSW